MLSHHSVDTSFPSPLDETFTTHPESIFRYPCTVIQRPRFCWSKNSISLLTWLSKGGLVGARYTEH